MCSKIFRQCLSKYTGLSTYRWNGFVSQYHQTSGNDAIQGDGKALDSEEQSPRSWKKRQRKVVHQKDSSKITHHGDTVTSRTKVRPREDQQWFQGTPEERNPPFREQYQKHDETQHSPREDVKRPFDEPFETEQPTFFKPIHHDKAAQEMLLVQAPKQPENPHLLKVAIIGIPNVGKSTFINSLLGRRIFAVSKKVHTTRSKAFAVINQDNKQIMFLDTPGIVDYKIGRRHHLARSLLTDHRYSLLEADLVAVLVDASHRNINLGLHFEIRKQLCLHPHLKSILILNKTDLVKSKYTLMGITARLTGGKIGGRSFQITEQAAAKIGSLDRWSFMKATYKPPSVDSLRNADNKDKIAKSEEHTFWCETLTGDDDFDKSVEYQPIPLGNNVTDESDVTDESSVTDEETQSVKSSQSEQQIFPEAHNMESLQSEKQIHRSEDSSELKTEITDLSPNQSSRVQKSEDEVEHKLTEIGEKTMSNLESMCSSNQSDPDAMATCSMQEGQVDQQSKADVMTEYISNLKENALVRSPGDTLSFEELLAKEKAAKEEQAKKRAEEKELNTRVAKMHGWDGFDTVFMISAKHGDGIKEVKNYLLDQTTPRDWEYHDDVVTNLSPEEVVKEAIREQLLELFHQEIPYLVEQRNDFWDIGEFGELKIVQELICPRESHSRIIQSKIGKIAVRAQQQLMNAFHCEVHLVLGVSVDKRRLRRLGI